MAYYASGQNPMPGDVVHASRNRDDEWTVVSLDEDGDPAPDLNGRLARYASEQVLLRRAAPAPKPSERPSTKLAVGGRHVLNMTGIGHVVVRLEEILSRGAARYRVKVFARDRTKLDSMLVTEKHLRVTLDDSMDGVNP